MVIQAAKIKATLKQHSIVRNSVQVLGLCDTGEKVSYKNKNGFDVNIPCDDSNGMWSPIINKHAGFQQGESGGTVFKILITQILLVLEIAIS